MAKTRPEDVLTAAETFLRVDADPSNGTHCCAEYYAAFIETLTKYTKDNTP